LRFFVGLHQPSDAKHFDASFVSVNRLRNRKSSFVVGDWIMDSGAFTTISTHGGYPLPVSAYADEIRRIVGRQMHGNMLAAVAQDYMCEAWMLEKTGLTIADHQRLTIERYDELLAANTGVYIMPVLQGYSSKEYVTHIRAYGDRLAQGAWVGVGSVCKRNSDPCAIWKVLQSIKDERPDLRLHGFGLKTTSLESHIIRALLWSADSMAWSFAARRQRRNANDYREALSFAARIEAFPEPAQHAMFA
jgi:transcriptional regulator of met regulon